MISTKGRYALRVMVDLAEHTGEGYLPLKDIALRQDISQKYLESIMGALSKAGLVDGQHGKGGGYRLNRPADEYTAAAILKCMEGSLAPVACLSCNENTCPRAAHCKTLPMWKKLDTLIEDFFTGVTLLDLAQHETAPEYII